MTLCCSRAVGCTGSSVQEPSLLLGLQACCSIPALSLLSSCLPAQGSGVYPGCASSGAVGVLCWGEKKMNFLLVAEFELVTP